MLLRTPSEVRTFFNCSYAQGLKYIINAEKLSRAYSPSIEKVRSLIEDIALLKDAVNEAEQNLR